MQSCTSRALRHPAKCWHLLRPGIRTSFLKLAPLASFRQQLQTVSMKSIVTNQKVHPSRVDLEKLAQHHGTPYQLYDEKAIRDNARHLIASFRKHFPTFHQHFAVKALPNPAILRIMLEEGCGLDCSSATELFQARLVGCPGNLTSYTSNYTSHTDLAAAAQQGVILNLDDPSLVQHLAEAVQKDGSSFPDLISFRLNPGVLGGPDAKFGVAPEDILRAYADAKKHGATKFGIHMMTGSCVMSNTYWEETVGRMLDTVAMVRLSLGIEFEFVNVGGGLGVAYQEGEPTVDVEQLAAQMRKVFDEKLEEHKMPEPHLHMENGRYMTGPYGWLVARCHVIKESHGKTYYGLDASMANLMRPGMYNSYHHITVPKREQPEAERHSANVVGTLCENNDWFAKHRDLPKAQIGDLFVIHDTGAHGHSMGFNYNGHLRAPELLARGDNSENNVHLIRTRETMFDLFANCVPLPN